MKTSFLLSSSELKGKRILFVSSLFPPDVIGGAENSAANLANFLKSRGAIIGVLTTSKSPEEQLHGQIVNGIKTWRIWMPRHYPMWHFPTVSCLKKPLWHLQDHIDPRNRKVLAKVINVFKPDLASIHIMQGIGHNAILEFVNRNIPIAYFLHDLGLACVRMSMFKNGRNCLSQCTLCRLSSKLKLRFFKKSRDLCFISPSKSNLEKLSNFFPVKNWITAVLLNANNYPKPSIVPAKRDNFRLLYAGRLHSSKGVAILLNAAEQFTKTGRTLSVTIAGKGPEERALKKRFGSHKWISFLGFISQQQLSNEMVNHDFLCVPSIWAENSPGVVIHALNCGLPILASNQGGIPELIQNGINGFVLSENTALTWQGVLTHFADDPISLKVLRDQACSMIGQFDYEHLGFKIELFLSSFLNSINRH